MGDFNSDYHYIHCCGQESFRRNGVALTVNKRVRNVVLGRTSKWQNDLVTIPRQTIQYHSNPSLCPNHWCWSWSWLVQWSLTTLSKIKTEKRGPFHHTGLEYKSRKSRDTWNNRQVWPRSTKWSRAKSNRVSKREYAVHSRHTFPTTQEMILHMGIIKWTISESDWLYLQLKMEKRYRVLKNKVWS